MLAALLGAGSMPEAAAQTPGNVVPDVSVGRFAMERHGKYLTVEMEVDLSALSVDANRAVVLTPRLVNGKDSLDLPAIGIYGRRRYYYYVRNGISTLSGSSGISCLASKKPEVVSYRNPTIYQEWMNGAELSLHRCDWGCCRTLLAAYAGALGEHNEAFFPELVYVRPEAETMKSRSLSGSAFIDFPVDRTDIFPDYRRNGTELGKIQATIDSVRTDKDVSIVSVWLKGYASPESPYAHNKELAIGRTEALKKYIRQLFHFADGVIVTDYEPEDWEGLRRYVERSDLDHREEILAMIDSSLAPDAKEAKIKRTYPEEYAFLLRNCYPALRHTDYRIDYNVRSYSNIEEIRRIMAERPEKLSLNEFYLVAQEYEPGTEEFTAVFETAVRMFPDDPVANLNAANAAMRHDDPDAAAGYLDKAGDSAEAFYARGALAIRAKDYAAAVRHMKRADAMGLREAEAILAELKERGYLEKQ